MALKGNELLGQQDKNISGKIWNSQCCSIEFDDEALDTVGTRRLYDPELGEVTAYCADESRFLPGQKASSPMQHKHCLLRFGLHRHKPHIGPERSFDDCFRIGGITFTALHERLNVLWWDQSNLMTAGSDKPRPVMGTRASLHGHDARRQLGEECLHLTAPQLTAKNGLSRRIDCVKLEDMLCKIDSNDRNLSHGWSPSDGLQRPDLGTPMPRGGHPPHQAEIDLRAGIEIDRSQRAAWLGHVAWLLAPLVELTAAQVMASPVIHADDSVLQKHTEGMVFMT